MGQNHIRTYSQMDGVELVGIADVDKKRVESLSKQYDAQGFLDYHELLNHDLDAVSVVVPTTLHKRVAIDVINKGVNLLVEKPIADSIDNATAVVEAAAAQCVKLMVGHIERFNPAIIKMKKLIESGALGKIVCINTRRVGPYNPRIRDVGVILDIGVHDIDIISYLYHSQPEEVYAIAGNDIHSQEDHASIMLRFGNNKAGFVETNWLTPHKIRTFTVIGTEAVGYGASFTIETSDSSAIDTVVFMALNTVTHSFDTNQRYVGLDFSVIDESALTATAPIDGNHAPPGYYQLFIVDGDGVPSESLMVQLTHTPPPPPACEGDANGDGLVDPLDAGYVLARFGCPVGTGDPDCDAADQNGDIVVDPLDYGFVQARFGDCS